MLTIILLPLQKYIPTLGGFSILFLLFAVLAAYILFYHPQMVLPTLIQPVFLAGFVLFFLAFGIESMHPDPSYTDLLRFALMIGGAVAIAQLCRDKKALRSAIYGYIIASLPLSIFLFLSIYGSLSGATATDYNEASAVRQGVFSETVLQGGNLNELAFGIAQAVSVALVLTLTAQSVFKRALWLGITLICFVATALPMSRSAIMVAIVPSAIVMFKCRSGRMWGAVVGIVLAVGFAMWVPEVIYSRMVLSEGARASILSAAIEHLPEYIMAGVGMGNFWKTWGFQSGFAAVGTFVAGAHNVFFQITIFWGLAGLLPLLALIWQAYRCFPKRCADDIYALCLLGIAVSCLLLTFTVQTFYGKEFSLALGLLVAARQWIWPDGIIRASTRRRKPPARLTVSSMKQPVSALSHSSTA